MSDEQVITEAVRAYRLEVAQAKARADLAIQEARATFDRARAAIWAQFKRERDLATRRLAGARCAARQLRVTHGIKRGNGEADDDPSDP